VWIGPREIRYGVTFGGVIRVVAAGFPFKGRNRLDGSRSVSESLAFLACFTCANWLSLPPAGRPKFLFWLHHFTVCCGRLAQAPRSHHPLDACFTRAAHVSPPYTQSTPSPVRRFHVSWLSDCSAVRSAVLELQLQFGRFLTDKAVQPPPASSLQHSRRDHRHIRREDSLKGETVSLPPI
jgi:hypothetical protein